jgi:excisionase family DNA binding protein
VGTPTYPQERVEAKGRPAMNQSSLEDAPTTAIVANEIPLTVKEAAKYLGVSSQTVYLWVERKQIPHLRVMGRNIRFLKPDLDSFRASFRQEMENA